MKNAQNNFIRLAFEQAKINLGQTGTNPSVGCLLVKNNCVLATGTTSVRGRPHAEFNVLNKINNIEGCSLFLSLEPCSHYGKTKPCTNLIIKKKN